MAKRKTTKSDDQAGRTGEFGSAIAQICEEKGISKERVVETIEAALAAAYKKDYGKKGQNIRAEFDEVSGGAKFFLVKEVVDETLREFVDEKAEEAEETADKADKKMPKDAEKMQNDAENDEEKLPRFNPERDFTLEEAKEIKKNAKIGDVIELELPEKKDYGRVAAQTAKQVIIQRIREAERDAMYDEYKNREGEVINGTVQRVEGRNVFVELGKSVGVLFPSEQIERESYRIGQRIKVYVMKVDAGSKGPGITLSRTTPEMVRKMFELEVPEIFSGTVEIKSIAREAGERTKIAVSSTEEGIDPIGSCVGQKGTRVQAVIDELGGEKIDIIAWNDDTAKFISASLSPAKVLRVDIDESEKEAVAVVPEDQLSLAIGKRGQNVRLAAKLTGWKIDINGAEKETSEDAEEKKEEAEIKENSGEEVKEDMTEKNKEE
ncbi:MAG: transcription termination/antitermination protein NusA [Patescibacteria group bacterium]|nr:transcription termination/antitermination protein NusA [Patescibacteria group bacterium]